MKSTLVYRFGMISVALLGLVTAPPALSSSLPPSFSASPSGSLVDNTPLDPSSEVESDNPQIRALAAQITEGAMSDREKAQAIHDWVASNIFYDWRDYLNGSYVNLTYDAVTVLGKRYTVCYGYSNLYAALARAVRVPTRVVIGQIRCVPRPGEDNCQYLSTSWSPHAWNEAFFDNHWAPIDTTWDAPYIDPSTMQPLPYSELSEKYFDPYPEEFALDHRAN